jgi:hypothetical protein
MISGQNASRLSRMLSATTSALMTSFELFIAIGQRSFRIDTVYQILVIVSIKIGLIAQSLFSYLTRDSLRDRQQRAIMDSEAIHRAVRL